ncbi:MAG: radical SAM protein [Sulfolobales archaeon]|nr:radical SAM protein [Sulfolobales archaeon]MDW8082635.1 radical SAM protein [Sulfolobales archaeon]
MKEARLYEVAGDGLVKCLTCEKTCLILPGRRGSCGNYYNIDGRLTHLGYGKLSAIESRPIEIKPLFHYWPNSTALTYSTWGCNFYCPWCQNYHLSFTHPSGSESIVAPERLVEIAIRRGDEGLSASFNEPTVNFDYVVDASEIARKRGLYSMVVTNNYFTERALRLLVESGVDGFSADIKGCPSMKKALVGVDHFKVFQNAKLALDLGAHVEMVYLVVTNTNDFEECYEWIIDNHLKYLESSTPLHVNRYYPIHRWREPQTPLEELLKIREEAVRAGVEFVYIGNTDVAEFESTKCPSCGKMLIERSSYRVTYFNLDKAGNKYRCSRCGREIPLRGRYISEKRYWW